MNKFLYLGTALMLSWIVLWNLMSLNTKQKEQNEVIISLTNKLSSYGSFHDVIPPSTTKLPAQSDRTHLYDFVPATVHTCEDLWPNANKKKPFADVFMKVQVAHDAVIKKYKLLEGHSAQLKEQVMTMYHLANQSWVQTVCETGFHAGHSALTWLVANRNAKLYSFDIGRYKYSRDLAEYVKALYPERFFITWGDSTKTLPDFIKNNPEVKCDLIFVDGGHTTDVATRDIVNMRQMASHQHNVIIFDDYPGYDRLGPAWQGAKIRDEIREIFSCPFNRPAKQPRGFSVGEFVFQ